MRVHCLALLFLPNILTGAEIPRHQLGTSCDDIKSREASLGSVLIKWKSIPGTIPLAYTVFELKQTIPVLFLCKQNKLWTENHFLPATSLAKAGSQFQFIYDHLFANYGPAFADATPWLRGQKQLPPEKYIPKSPDHYMAAWKTASFNINLSVMPNNLGENSGWRTFVVVSKPAK